MIFFPDERQDPKTLDWWLIQSVPTEEANVSVGYWPKELFSNSFEVASNVQMGGKVFNPPLTPDKAPMGSGHFVPEDLLQTASVVFWLLDSSLGFIPQPQMVVLADVPDSYQAQYIHGTTVMYGGPDIQTVH